MNLKIRLLAIFLLLQVSGNTQQTGKQITHQSLYWIAYFNTLDFGKHWFLTTEIQERRFIEPHEQHQLVTRSHLHYRLGAGWDVAAGFTYFLQSPNDPYSATRLVVPELRPHIEFNYKQNAGRILINHRYKAEWRFFHNTSNDELIDGYWNYFRFRYRLGIDFILIKDKNEKGGLKLRLNDEVHVNAGSGIVRNTFDQNRMYVGLNYQLLKSISVELGYLNWYQQRTSGNQFYDRDIIRFALQHKINLGKKQ
ncbi:MAG: DUF2490 domain-containing protein [Flavobacteriales bacterium]